MEISYNKREGFLFALILLLVFISALLGWTSPRLYSNNAADLIVKLRYYDLSFLAIAIPAGLISWILALYGNYRARLFTLGWVVYITFSFLVTLFTARQNYLFLVYVAILSLCAFYFVQVYSDLNRRFSLRLERKQVIFISISLLFSGLSGFIFWLSEAIQSLSLPSEDLLVKAPQVLDMAFVLPLTVYGAISLWRKKTRGIWISSLCMLFFMFIGISVVTMEWGLVVKTGAELDAGLVYSYSFISLLNLVVAIQTYRKLSFITS